MNSLQVRTEITGDERDNLPRLYIKAMVDNLPLVDFEADLLAIDVGELRKSANADGEFFIVTCWCSYPGCAGIREGILVYRDRKNVHWVMRGPGSGRTFVFEQQAYATAIEQGMEQLRQLIDCHPDLDVVPESTFDYLGLSR